MKITNKLPLIILIIILISAANLFAGTTGKITGRVLDSETGDPLIGANVLVEGTNNGASTDADGYFTIINVLPGTYTVVVRYIGYSSLKIENVQVSVDRTTKLDEIKMSAQTISVGEVVVQAKKPPIQKDRTHSESIVNTKTIESLPVTNLQEVIQLQPGIVSSGGELHFRGGRGREVAYLIDGIPVSNDFNQSGGSNVSIENEMVSEVEVISGTFNAEYGSAQSGVVNIVTKGAARYFSGSVKLYSGEWLSGKDNTFLGVSNFNPLAEKDFQFSLTGPIISDKLGFFTSGRYNNSQSLYWYQRRFNPIDGWKIAAYEKWYQDHNPDELANTQAIYIPDSLYTGDMSEGPLNNYQNVSLNLKLDYNPVPSMKITYALYGSWGQTTGGDASRRYQPDQTNTSTSWSQQHFITIRHSPSASFFYNIGASFQHNTGETYYRKDNKIALYPGDTGIMPITSSADGFSLGSTGGFFTGQDGKNYRNLYLVNGDINWQADRFNFIKAGFEYKQHEINTYSWGYLETKAWETKKWPDKGTINPSDYDFNTYYSMLIDYWKNWESEFDTVRYRKVLPGEYTQWRDYTIRPMQAALYLQDKVELGEIIINAGLRFDIFKANEKYPVNKRAESYMLGSETNLAEASTKTQLSPRLGISFPISATGAFHASYGHFFQMPSFQYMYNEPLYVLTPLQLEGMTLGNANLDAEKTISYEIGLQQEIVTGLTVDVTAFYKDFRNLLGVENVTTVDNIGYTRFINRDYGYTKGITLGVRKGGSDFVTGSINYTFSYANGSSSDPTQLQVIQAATQIGGQPVEFVDRQVLPLNWDQRHTLNLILNLNQPDDWTVSFIGSLDSGLPYSPTFIEKYNIPVREYKNSDTKPMKWNLDFKAKKFFEMGGMRYVVYLKVDNVFDHLNELTVYSTSGRATYQARLPQDLQLEEQRLAQEGLFTLHQVENQPTWFSSPRKVQLGIEVHF